MNFDRRNFCQAAAAVGVTGALRLSVTFAQSRATPIPVRTLNHVTLLVSDVQRSINFYQSLFGMPLQASPGAALNLTVGSGPQFITVIDANAPVGIDHFCFGIDGFDLDRLIGLLAEHGLTSADTRSPMTVRVSIRGPEQGGAPDGTPELYVYDPDGIGFQLQATDYCGGEGALGTVCPPQPQPENGRLAVQDLNHVTLSVSNRERSTSFYQAVLGMPVQAYQGTTPALAVGAGPQFVTVATDTATGATPGKPNIAHVCMTTEGFDPDRITRELSGFGIEPTDVPTGPPGPLRTWVKQRTEALGGAPGGTPELYLTDPDGIILQLQDVSYCGGSGYLGDVCA